MMKNILLILSFVLISFHSTAQINIGCEGVSAFDVSRTPDLGVVISSGDAETVWNAMRLAVYSQSQGDSVVVFVTGKALDVYMNDSTQFKIHDVCTQFFMGGGDIFACATCAKLRKTEEVQSCTITSIRDLYAIIKRSKKVISF